MVWCGIYLYRIVEQGVDLDDRRSIKIRKTNTRLRFKHFKNGFRVWLQQCTTHEESANGLYQSRRNQKYKASEVKHQKIDESSNKLIKKRRVNLTEKGDHSDKPRQTAQVQTAKQSIDLERHKVRLKCRPKLTLWRLHN